MDTDGSVLLIYSGLCYYMSENPKFADKVLHNDITSTIEKFKWIAMCQNRLSSYYCSQSIVIFMEECVRIILIPLSGFLDDIDANSLSDILPTMDYCIGLYL
jgi:hypothetical protein